MKSDIAFGLMFFIIGWIGGVAYITIKIDYNCYIDGNSVIRGTLLTCNKEEIRYGKQP